jgi:hypothetical protein
MQNIEVNPAISKNRATVLALLNTLPKQLTTTKKVLPNFLVLGPPKTGTTSLYKYLEQHPDIYMPALKNPAFFIYEGQDRKFFGRNVINTLTAYHVLFQQHSQQKAIGEISPGYLPDYSAPARIYQHLPKVKMITILRNPIERAWSQFIYNRQIKVERFDDFSRIINSELRIMEGRRGEGTPKYIRAGMYYKHLTRYYEFFDPKQLLILWYDDFVKEPLKELKRIFTFLGVDTGFVPDTSTKYNITYQEAINEPDPFPSLASNGLLIRNNTGDINLTSSKSAHKSLLPVIPVTIKNKLKPVFLEDVLSLQKMLNKDLSHWFL